jgi:hypothetical protein
VNKRWLLVVALLVLSLVLATAAEAKVTLVRVTSPISASPERGVPAHDGPVVTMTNNAIASGNYGPTKNLFDTFNNLGSPGFCGQQGFVS